MTTGHRHGAQLTVALHFITVVQRLQEVKVRYWWRENAIVTIHAPVISLTG